MACFDWIYSLLRDHKPILQEDPQLTVDILAHTVEITHVDD